MEYWMNGLPEYWVTGRVFPGIGKIRSAFSRHWKNPLRIFQPLEPSKIQQSNIPAVHSKKTGVALIVVMWVLVILSLIVTSFAFEMKLEANIITVQRKRFQADQLARAGIELAKAMIAFQEDPLEGDDVVYDDPWMAQAAKIDEGVPITYSEELGAGKITLNIDFEKGRRSIRKLDADSWRELFAQTGIPSTDWDELYGCLVDWQDENELHGPNGAESDDKFYRDRGYECKNAPVDTVDELLLIKGWTEEVVYGTPPEKIEETEYPLTGLAQHLTIWGEGQVNPNSATPEVLRSLYLSDQMIDAILEMRLGPDGVAGTEDDGLTQEDFDALGLDGSLLTLQPEFVTISVEGEVGGAVSKISSVFKLGDKMPTPLFWIEP
jgi:general secretion pathway protein K